MMMTRDSYMRELDRLLSKVPEPIRKEWLYDYYIHFEQAHENGQTEQEAALELGDPRTIANELLLGYRVEQAESTPSFGKLSKAVFATVGLGLFNIIFILGPYIAIAAVLLSLWVCVLAMAIAAIAIVVESVTIGSFSLGQALSVGLVCIALALLLGIGLKVLTRSFFAVTLKYLKFNTRVMRGSSK